jgi:outer membrane protein assembly factor BamB
MLYARTFITFVIVLLSLLSGLLYAQSITDVYELPNTFYFNSAYGLASDSNSIFLSSYSSSSPIAGSIVEFDLNGTQIDTLPTPLGSSQGLAWDGTTFWYFYRGTSTTSRIYQISSTGIRLDSISTGTQYIGGLCWDGTGLWYSLYYPNNEAALYKIDTNTKLIVDTIQTLGAQPQGIAYDGTYYYYAMDDNDGDPENIYIYDPIISDTVGYIPIADPISTRPRGLAWDSQHLWLVADPVGPVQRALFKFDLSGGGTPNIQLSAASLNFGLTSVGDTSVRYLTILNVGDSTLNISSIDINTPEFIIDTSILPLNIEPGNNFPLEVRFTPYNQGPVSGVMSIHSNDPYEPIVDVSLSGQGQFVNPAIWLSQDSHHFGNVWVPVTEGVSKWILEIANIGNQNLNIENLTLNSPEFYLGGISGLPIIIAPNDTFDLDVFFEPTAAQLFRDTLFIQSNDPSQPFVFVELMGTGISGPFDLGYQFWNYQVPDNPRAGSFQDYEVDGLRPINDITGDGIEEVVIATENYWILCLNGAGSGTTDTLWSFITYISNSSAGSIGANFEYGVQDAIQIASDLNNDGFNDVVIATGGGNEHVYAINGTNGEKLWEYGTDDPNSYGLGDFEAVDVRRDFNGDAVPDVLAIADGNGSGTGYKSAYLFNGSDGAIIWQYAYPGPNPSFGKTIISIDDVTGDNQPDAIIAVGNNGTTNLKTYCLDGQTGLPVWDHDAVYKEPKELFELPIPGETPDIIVSEYYNTIQRLDGETGIPHWTINLGGGYGIIEINLISDVNNDSIDDILVASLALSGNIARCLSGVNGNPLWTYPTEQQFGISAIPDLNNDGIDEVLLGTGDRNIPTFGNFFGISGSGDSVLFNQYFPGDKVYTVHGIRSIDGNGSYELLAGTKNGQVFCWSGGQKALTGTAVKPALVLHTYRLDQNYPNPFNPSTMIRYEIPLSHRVSIKVYDILGREIATLIDHSIPSGKHQVMWHTSNIPSGIYYYRIQAGDYQETKKMILMK